MPKGLFMSLGEQLERLRAGAVKRVPEDQRAVMGAATEELRQSGILDTAASVAPISSSSLKTACKAYSSALQ